MKKLYALAFASFISSSLAYGHANLMPAGSVPPRNTIANKTGPCGINRDATTQVTTNLTPGQQLTVTWEETIDHLGYFQIWFSPNADDSNMVLLEDRLPDQQGGTLPHQYSKIITVPNVACTNCTIRLIQVMQDNPNMDTYYYSCANIAVAATGVITPPAPVISAPTPSANSGSGSASVNCNK